MNITLAHEDPYPFQEFAPTLSQCYVIVIAGYLMARLEILNASELKGVIGFASYFAMPGIICLSLADANFDDFRWELLLGIFFGKSLIFLFVAGFLILLNGNIGVAGAVAIFMAQSNDLPVGNPLMQSLYTHHRPQMLKYLFLIPAMTVIFFVPISKIMIRLHGTKRQVQRKPEQCPAFKDYLRLIIWDKENLKEIYQIATNPVVIATILGLTLNAIFKGNLPESLHQPIKVAAETIPGIALAMLGFSFVRKERYLISSAVIPAMVLVILKMVLTPILLHAIMSTLTFESKSTRLLSDFALLYGIISPATAVFQIGQEFRKPLAAMSVALILTSFSCFPVSYIVARITIAPINKLSSYLPVLKHILFWTACITILCDAVVFVRIITRNRCRQVSQCYIMCLLLTQFLTCSGLLIWISNGLGTWPVYCQMALLLGGEISGYLWSGILAVVLIFREKYFILAKNGFIILFISAFSVSAGITTVICLIIPYADGKSVYVVLRPRAKFEFIQLIVTTFLLAASMIVVAVSLIHHFTVKKPRDESEENQVYENSLFYILEQEETHEEKSATPQEKEHELKRNSEAKIYYEEIVENGHGQNDLCPERREWTFLLSSLLILQGLSMVVRFIANLYKLSDSKHLEVMIPLEFFQSTLFFGQGVFMLLTFGVDIRTAIITARRWWRKHRYGAVEMTANFVTNDAKGEDAQFCNQFYNFYYTRCFLDIAKDRRWKDAIYKDSFWGHQLVDWMITEGLCIDDSDAEGKGQKLLVGGVLKHVTGKHHFYDAPYLYCFNGKPTAPP